MRKTAAVKTHLRSCPSTDRWLAAACDTPPPASDTCCRESAHPSRTPQTCTQSEGVHAPIPYRVHAPQPLQGTNPHPYPTTTTHHTLGTPLPLTHTHTHTHRDENVSTDNDGSLSRKSIMIIWKTSGHPVVWPIAVTLSPPPATPPPPTGCVTAPVQSTSRYSSMLVVHKL